MNKNGNAVEKSLDINMGTLALNTPNADFTIENTNGDLYINAKRIFINGKEIK